MAENSKEPCWYVVHTYSGYENKVKDNIEKSVENNPGMQRPDLRRPRARGGRGGDQGATSASSLSAKCIRATCWCA